MTPTTVAPTISIAPTITHFPSQGLTDEPICYTLTMYDSYGDGWNDAYWTIDSQTGTLSSGATGTEILCLQADCYAFEVGDGDWPSEVSWAFADSAGTQVVSQC